MEDCKDFDEERIIPDEVIDAFVVKIVAHEDGLDWYLRFKPDPEDPVKCHVDGDKRKGGKTPSFAYGITGCYQGLILNKYQRPGSREPGRLFLFAICSTNGALSSRLKTEPRRYTYKVLWNLKRV